MSTRGEPDGLYRVESVKEIEHLPPEARAVLVLGVDDGKLAALSRHPSVETIFTDGNSQATDEGVAGVARLPNLRDLDLEWSQAITDRALAHLAAAPHLRWVDLTGCSGVTQAGIEALCQARPELEIEPAST